MLEKPEGMVILRSVLISVGVGLAVSAGLLLGISGAATAGELSDPVIPILSFLPVGLGSFLSGFLCARLLRNRGLLFGALCGAVIFLPLFIAGYFLSGGVTAVAAIKLAVTVCAAAIGGVAGVNLKKKSI